MNIDFLYRSIEIDKEKVVTSINVDDFPIEMDDLFIDSYRLLSIHIHLNRFC